MSKKTKWYMIMPVPFTKGDEMENHMAIDAMHLQYQVIEECMLRVVTKQLQQTANSCTSAMFHPSVKIRLEMSIINPNEYFITINDKAALHCFEVRGFIKKPKK